GALRTDLDLNLIGVAADTAGADLDARLHIVERFVEHAYGLALQARLDALESAIDDAFGNRLLTVEHDRIHELGEDDVPELGIGEDFALFWAATTRHWMVPFSSAGSGTSTCPGLTLVDYLGRLAPYLERDCLRSLTPWVSSTPRST